MCINCVQDVSIVLIVFIIVTELLHKITIVTVNLQIEKKY